MDIKTFLEETIDDIAALEVATLTKAVDTGSLNLKLAPEEDDKATIKAAEAKVKEARDKLLAILGEDTEGSIDVKIKEIEDGKEKTKLKAKRKKVRAARRYLRETERQLDDTRKGLGIFDPKDIFSKIRVGLVGGDLVAYSRFELEGDCVAFVSSDPAVQGLVDKHTDMVAAAQETRKGVFDAAIQLFRGDK